MLTNEDVEFFREFRMVQDSLEERVEQGEVFMWSPNLEVKVDVPQKV